MFKNVSKLDVAAMILGLAGLGIKLLAGTIEKQQRELLIEKIIDRKLNER